MKLWLFITLVALQVVIGSKGVLSRGEERMKQLLEGFGEILKRMKLIVNESKSKYKSCKIA